MTPSVVEGGLWFVVNVLAENGGIGHNRNAHEGLEEHP
jgi:hypothetical protein